MTARKKTSSKKSTATRAATTKKKTAMQKKASSRSSGGTKKTSAKKSASGSAAPHVTEKVVTLGGEGMKQLFGQHDASQAYNAAQEHAFAFGREGAAQLAKSADSTTKSFSEAMNLGHENMEAFVECSNIATSMTKSISEEVFQMFNSTVSDNAELSKELFSCRTINDVFDLQNKMVRNSMDTFFNESLRFSELFFQYTTEAVEPLNERVSEAANRLTKTFTNVA